MAEIKIKKDRIREIKNEIAMSVKFNEEELEPRLSESLQRYTGEWLPHFGADWDIVLNEVYPIVQNNLPSIFFRNPRAYLKPRNKTFIAKKRDTQSGKLVETQLDSQKSARTQEDILNYSLSEIKYKEETRRTLLDALLFPYGVLWHGYKGDFGMTEENSWFIKDDKVFVKRISPMRFIYDPTVTASNIHEGQWVGRIIDIRMRDLVEDDRLDVDKRLIKGFKGFGELVGTGSENNLRKSGVEDFIKLSSVRKPLLDFSDSNFKNSEASKFVRVYEIFLRPTKKEARQGSNGWILLLTDEQDKALRVNSWKIKAEGFPAKLLEFNPVPDQKLGLSDPDTYKQIADQKNVITNLQIRNAQTNTKVWVGVAKDGTSEDDIEKIENGENTILMFETDDVRKRLFVASPGAQASSELFIMDQRIQQNLEDKSGVTDLKRGFLRSGEESATSVKLRAAGGGARPAYRQDIMSDFLRDSLHYLNQLNKQFMPIKEAVRIIGSLDLEWSENPSKEELQADVDVEIDVISMLPENPEEELRRLNEILGLMVQGLTIPEVRAKLEQEGKTINIAPVIEQILVRQRIRDPDILRNIKPEESQGFVSAQQMRQAQANVEAALTNQQIPFPPNPEDDHRTKLEVYSGVKRLLDATNNISERLELLIETQSALLQQLQDKEASVGQKVNPGNFKPGKVQTFGAG